MGQNQTESQHREKIRAYLAQRKAAKARQIDKGRKTRAISGEFSKAMSLKKGETISRKFPSETKALAKKLIKVMPKDKSIPPDRLALAAAKHMMGDSLSAAAKQVGINVRLVHELFTVKFPERKAMDEMLEDVMLTNANLASAIFAQKAHELSARDAAVAAGIFSTRYLEKKAEREGRDRPSVPILAIIQLEKTLKSIEGKVIEAETPKQLKDSDGT